MIFGTRIALLFCFLASLAAAQPGLVSRVHPLIGTGGEGQTFPAAGMPFAMTQWTPATRMGEAKCIAPYYFADRRIYGIRGSHFMSGSCTQDYGSVQLVAGTGTPDLRKGPPSSSFNHAQEHASPEQYSVELPELGTTASVTGTTRSGLVRFRMHQPGQSWLLVENTGLPGDGIITLNPAAQEVTGYNRVRRLYAGQGQLAGFAGYFVVRFNRRFTHGGTFNEGRLHAEGRTQTSSTGPSGSFVLFDLKAEDEIVATIGTSFTSVEEARRNLQSEIRRADFNTVSGQARAAWEQQLGGIEVAAPPENTSIFYTALYHASLLPRVFSDVSGTYPSFGGGKTTERAVGFTDYNDFSAWDTFRALHPLFTILDPTRELDMVRSLIEMGRQGGFLPIFPAWNSYTSEMVGDHATAIIGDAWLKGMRGFDLTEAYALMRKNATETPGPAEYHDGQGRRALPSYLKYGYIPLEDPVADAFHTKEQVSRTLEYAYDDFVLSQVAKSLGKQDDAALFARRAQNFRNVIDPVTGFARGRHADGTWVSPFDPAKTASYITEGLPFQYTFFVPQDIPGLIDLEGGRQKFIARLDELFARNLYDHGNEPSHHIGYLYDDAGEPWKTQQHVHEVMTTQYSDLPAGLAGNDDAGQISAWYIMSALGFYQVTPGVPTYALGTPHFPEMTIRLEDKRTFHIVARGLSRSAFYVQAVTLNGKPLHRFWITHEELMRGGELIFQMGDQPATSGSIRTEPLPNP